MLEGMANSEALAVAGQTGRVLLYTPVKRHEDFPAAVAYLVRRLDENTSEENYLSASFDMSVDNDKFKEQQSRFLISIAERHTISTESRRHHLDRHDSENAFSDGKFENQSDADATNPEFRKQLGLALARHHQSDDVRIPLQIMGEFLTRSEVEVGSAPSPNAAP